ncbi:MAG: shikimate kinase [Holophagaceae bacterium]|uniref:Shikimate kinase n=1 Tax=Candidatus Geothrix skivensis TaxID=2954439 RepID=A0A9D7SHW5_9BACT|nr:shikimate kinase [Candidatus Geothrix skivensis]
MRIAIIGNSGSGKSTLARQIASSYGLTALDLDTLAWVPGKVAIPRDHTSAEADVTAFCSSNENWVVEGCYAGLIQTALSYSPVLIFIEPGVEACLSNCRDRPWEPHKYKSKSEQDEKLPFLLNWVRDYYSREGDLSLGAHHSLFESYQGSKRKIQSRVDPSFIKELAR